MLAVKQVDMPQSVGDEDEDEDGQRQAGRVNAIKAERDILERLDHMNIVQYIGFEENTKFFNVYALFVERTSDDSNPPLIQQVLGVCSWRVDRQHTPEAGKVQRGHRSLLHLSDRRWPHLSACQSDHPPQCQGG